VLKSVFSVSRKSPCPILKLGHLSRLVLKIDLIPKFYLLMTDQCSHFLNCSKTGVSKVQGAKSHVGWFVRIQHGVTASAGQRRGDVEIRNYLRDPAGSRILVFDLSIAHDRFESSSHPQQNWSLTHPKDIDAPLRIAAQRKDHRLWATIR
jgi:hypothetical protein